MPFRKRNKTQPATDPVEEFRRQVDFAAELFGLPSDLPEVVNLKEQAAQLVSDEMPDPVYYLRMLNPHHDVVQSGPTTVLLERWFGAALYPWSIARHFEAGLDRHLTKVVADERGTHLFTFSDTDPVFTSEGAAINPRQLADPGNRYQNACMIIKEFTGLDLDFTEHVGKAERIAVVKDVEGNWITRIHTVQPIS